MLRNWFQIQRFHVESSENFTLLEETVLSHRHPKRKWRYWLPPWWAFSTFSSSWKRWVPVAPRGTWWKKTIIMVGCLVRPVSCVSVGLALIRLGRGRHIKDSLDVLLVGPLSNLFWSAAFSFADSLLEVFSADLSTSLPNVLRQPKRPILHSWLVWGFWMNILSVMWHDRWKIWQTTNFDMGFQKNDFRSWYEKGLFLRCNYSFFYKIFQLFFKK